MEAGNKIEAGKRDYTGMCKTGICIPKLIDPDEQNERIIKEYIEGPTIYELVYDELLRVQ